MSFDESSRHADLIVDNADYGYAQTTSSPKDTMMHNIRSNMPRANTDYEPQAFANRLKLVDDPVPYSKSEEEEANNNDSDRYRNDSETRHDDHDDGNGNGNSNAETATATATAKPKYESQFNKVNGSTEDAKNKFKQQLGGKVFTSTEEETLAKYDIMRELGEMAHYQGVKLSQNYTLKSNYEDMLRERNLHKYIKDKHEGTKWLSDAFLHLVKGIEWSNQKWDPFGFNLDGWSDHVKGNLNDQYGTFSELYEKYVGQGVVIAPELKLLFALGSSAVQYHGYNSALQLLPNLGDDENKALIKKLREEAQAGDNKMKDIVNEKHIQANEQLQRLNFIKQKEREREEYNKNRGLYDLDNQTDKSLKSRDIQSEKERYYQKIRDLDMLEDKLKEMKSSGSVMSKKPSIALPSYRKNPQKSEYSEEYEQKQPRTQPQTSPKVTQVLNKYVKPKIVKNVPPSYQVEPAPVATSIKTPTTNVAPSQIVTRPIPRRLPNQQTQPQQTQIQSQPQQTQIQPLVESTSLPQQNTQFQQNTRNTKLEDPIPLRTYSPNIDVVSNKSKSSSQASSVASSVASRDTRSNYSSNVSSVPGAVSVGSIMSISSKSSSGIESLLSSQSGRSSVSSKHITPVNQIINKNNYSEKNSHSESSSIKSVHSDSIKIEKPKKQIQSTTGSNSGSSGHYTQYSGGSVSIIKGRNGKTKKVISIVTKPSSRLN